MNNVHVHTDDADVLYNKFNVNYNTEFPTVPNNPPLYPNSGYDCVVARQDWSVVNCSQQHHVICQGGTNMTLYRTIVERAEWTKYFDVDVVP